MSQNTELVQALKRILADSNFVTQTLSQNKDLDSTSTCVVESLADLLEYLDDAIEQFDI